MRNLTRLASLLTSARAIATTQNSCVIDRESWRRTLGDRIAQRSEPESLRGTTLTILVASSVWAQELSLLAPEIIQRLQHAGICISELRWRVGKLSAPTSPKAKTPKVVPLLQLPAEIERSLNAVKDAELRDAIFQAAAHMLARQQRALQDRGASARQPNAQAPLCAEPRIYRPDPSVPELHAISQRIRAKPQD
jgi:hypothetical protein